MQEDKKSLNEKWNELEQDEQNLLFRSSEKTWSECAKELQLKAHLTDQQMEILTRTMSGKSWHELEIEILNMLSTDQPRNRKARRDKQRRILRQRKHKYQGKGDNT